MDSWCIQQLRSVQFQNPPCVNYLVHLLFLLGEGCVWGVGGLGERAPGLRRVPPAAYRRTLGESRGAQGWGNPPISSPSGGWWSVYIFPSVGKCVGVNAYAKTNMFVCTTYPSEWPWVLYLYTVYCTVYMYGSYEYLAHVLPHSKPGMEKGFLAMFSRTAHQIKDPWWHS